MSTESTSKHDAPTLPRIAEMLRRRGMSELTVVVMAQRAIRQCRPLGDILGILRVDADKIRPLCPRLYAMLVQSPILSARLSPRIHADRQQFIDCAKGNLMTRDAAGRITQLGDAATHAVEAAERGEPVILTVQGKDFSRIEDGREIRL